uniref:PKcGMP_CC domain-containing protein n=1 Tax=Glossina pallidipes TaxID=7398 RepID=A0A1B0A617_GLOPL
MNKFLLFPDSGDKWASVKVLFSTRPATSNSSVANDPQTLLQTTTSTTTAAVCCNVTTTNTTTVITTIPCPTSTSSANTITLIANSQAIKSNPQQQQQQQQEEKQQRSNSNSKHSVADTFLSSIDGASINALDPPTKTQKQKHNHLELKRIDKDLLLASPLQLQATAVCDIANTNKILGEHNAIKPETENILLAEHKIETQIKTDTQAQDHRLRHSSENQPAIRASSAIDGTNEKLTINDDAAKVNLGKMQQEPNANIQFQPDLGLVSNNNLQTLSGTLDSSTGAIRLTLPLQTTDVLTHTLIYGTVPTAAQQLNTDPNLQTRNILHQQELQLQQRYQQLQQLQAQTQGIFATASPAPIVIQPTAAGVTAAGTVYATTANPTEFCAPSALLADQMQGLCISAPATAPAPAIMDPTAGGINLLSSSYIPATQQEERLIQIIQAKDLKIQEMQRAIHYKDTEIAELKSHLDKFQSVFPFSRSGATTPCGSASGGRKSGQSFQRQRAQGISAEPQSESMVLLDNVTFPKYEKDESK